MGVGKRLAEADQIGGRNGHRQATLEAVRTLQALGYSCWAGKWVSPAALGAAPVPMTAEADAMHGALMRHADALAGSTEGSEEEAELEANVDAIEAYEIKRWPLGKEPGGKG